MLNSINPFPFSKEWASDYQSLISAQFEKEKNIILHSILHDFTQEEQIFETEVELMKNDAYIRYLFPISYAKSLIQQFEIKPITMDVQQTWSYTKHIELDDSYPFHNEEPIIILQYPYAEPGFFVLDGNHRVMKSYCQQQSSINAYVLKEQFIPLLVHAHFFYLLAKIHRNVSYIGWYMVGEITYQEFKSNYIPIINSEY